MNGDKPFTIQQIRARFNKEKPKFIGLKNQEGQFEVPMNSPGITAEKRMQAIEAHFKKDSTPDGVYFFITRESLLKNSPERVVPIAKGNVGAIQLIEAPRQPVTVQNSKTETVWDSKTAIDIVSTKNQLEYENKVLREEISALKKQVAELEAELDGEDDDEGGTTPKQVNGIISGIKELSETFLPYIDKHFELEEKKLAIRGSNGQPVVQRNPNARSDGGIPHTAANYEIYFSRVVQEGTDEQLDHELEYLENANPSLCQALCAKYGIEDDEPEPNNTESDGNGS